MWVIYLVDIIHTVVFLGVIVSLACVWTYQDISVAFLLTVFSTNLLTNRCALTALENLIREHYSQPTIRSWIREGLLIRCIRDAIRDIKCHK